MSTTTDSKAKVATKDDPRPLVSDLLKKHAKVIADCQEAIKEDPLYKANVERYDDIFVLRYVMTHKNKAKPATAAIIKTMQFRNEKKLNEMGDVRHRLYNHQKTREENVDAFEILKLYYMYCDEEAVAHTLPDSDRGVVSFILPHHIDVVKVAKELTMEQLLEVYLYANEWIFQVMDEVTRRTGRLTKLLRVVDMVDFSFLQMDRNYIRADGAAAKVLEDYYPQLLGQVLVINGPAVLNAVWALFRPFFPKRMVEKVDFLSATKPSHVNRFASYISIENLPQRYGGKNPEWPVPYGGQRFEKPTQQS